MTVMHGPCHPGQKTERREQSVEVALVLIKAKLMNNAGLPS